MSSLTCPKCQGGPFARKEWLDSHLSLYCPARESSTTPENSGPEYQGNLNSGVIPLQSNTDSGSQEALEIPRLANRGAGSSAVINGQSESGVAQFPESLEAQNPSSELQEVLEQKQIGGVETVHVVQPESRQSTQKYLDYRSLSEVTPEPLITQNDDNDSHSQGSGIPDSIAYLDNALANQRSPENGYHLEIPISDPYYRLQKHLREKLDRLARRSEDGEIVNVLLLGPQGSGKTSLAKQFAAKHQRVCLLVTCGAMSMPDQWFGKKEFSPDRGTYYIPSKFVRACETQNSVIILDDMNRVENPKVLNPLYNLLDDQREIYLEEIERDIRVASGVVFFATANEGWEFAGVDPIDVALKDRFEPVAVKYPLEDIQIEILHDRTGIYRKDAEILVQWATLLRNKQPVPVNISLRQLLHAARDIAFGASIRAAIEFSVLGSIASEEREPVLQTLQPLDPDFDKWAEDGWESYV